jgi:hypothetical protein
VHRTMFSDCFRRSDRLRTGCGGRQIASCEVGSAGGGPSGAILAGICAAEVIVGVVDVGEWR